MVHEFKVPVGLTESVVSISVDAESGRAAIRVDGKMAGRPLGPDEDRCEIRVGNDRYEVRREWEGFELEFLGVVEEAKPAIEAKNHPVAAPSPRRKSAFPVGKALLALLAVAVVGVVSVPVKEVLVDWHRFMAPDNTFWAEMPGRVVEAKLGSFARAAGAKAWVAGRNDKIFEIGFVDVPQDVRPGWENEYINGVRDAIAKKYKGQVVVDKDWPGGTELMFHCEEWRDTENGPRVPRDVRLRLMIRGRRVVIAAASAPPGQLMSLTITRFFMSIKA